MALPPVFIEFLGSYAGVKAAAAGAKESIASVDAENSASMAKMGAYSKVALAAIGAAFVGVSYESLKAGISFQAAMLPISTQAGVAKSQLASLGNGVLALAGQVGFSPDSLATALYHVESSFASVGISGPKALSLLKIAAEGAAVGHADLVDVTNALDAAVVSGIPGVQDYNQAMGVLNATVGAGDMTMQDLADSFSTGLLATVKGFGLSITDVGAGLAVFGDNNIRGSQAATDLRMAVQNMAKPAATAGAELKHLGLSSTQLATDMQKGGLLPALEDLKKHMDAAGVSATQQGEVITELFGKKAGTGLNVLIDQLDRVKSKYPELTKGANSFGSAVAANDATIQQKMNDAKAAFDALGVKIGTALLPSATKVLGVLSKMIGYLTVHTSVFYAIAAGIGALGIAFLAASIASWSFTDSILADPVFWIALGIAALVAGIVELIVHWKAVAAWLSGAWHDTVSAVVAAWHWLASETSKVWDSIYGALMSAWHAVASFFSSAWHAVTDPIVTAWHWVAGVTSTVWNSISAFFHKWWPLLLLIFATPIAVVMSLWNHFHNGAFAIARVVWSAISGFFRTVWSGISAVATTVFNAVYSFFAANVHAVQAVFHAVWGPLSSFLSSVWRGIEITAMQVWGLIKAAIVNPVQSAYNSVESIFAKVKTAISSGINSALNWLDGLATTWEAVGKAIVQGIVHGVEDGASSAVNAIKNVANSMLKSAKSFLGINSPSKMFATQVGQWITHGIAQGVTGAAGVANSAVRSVASGMLGSVGGSRLTPSLGTSGGAGGVTVQNVVQVEVKGSVRSDRDLRDVVQQEMLRLGGRNMATWAPAKI